ncbi:MAG: hypothetical protein DHS20C18_23040 [Saprospiraceae bacterium]|nr:MAG: hypothetical protein DHS20C18_23040 [Saprospiraceae bacterium]
MNANIEKETISDLIAAFNIEGTMKNAYPFGNGHINDTFRIANQDSGKADYLLQRINHQIFPEVAAMMHNIRKVSEHVNGKSSHSTLSLILTKQGKDFYKDANGNYWRLYIFMKDLISYDVAETPEQIYEGARAFGRFLFHLSDFPATNLYPTLPNFHNVLTRLSAFRQAVEKDTEKRVKQADQIIKYVLSLAEVMSAIQKAGEAGKIPLRVTHNDTKFNNVLLDKNGKGRCVIDLETVMPGYVHYDFGDGVRTTITTAAEDEADLNLIQIDLHRFAAYAQGYLEETHTILTPIELKYLPLSGALLAYLMGVRFLTDFLQGDRYYKIHFDGQNLQRAKAQLELVRKMMERMGELEVRML